MAGMKRLCLTLITLSYIPAALAAQALPDSPQPAESSSSDWNNVAGLAHDQPIVVHASGGRHLYCLFTGATETTLFCEPDLTFYQGGEYHFQRADVDKVRLDQIQRNRVVVIAASSAGLAIFAACRSTDGARGLDGLIGAGVGGLAGWAISTPIAMMIPGHLVYHRSANPRQSSATQPAHHFLFRSAQ